MQKKSIRVLFIATFLLCYLVIDLAMYLYNWRNNYATWIAERQSFVNYVYLGEGMLRDGLAADYIGKLDEAKNFRAIDFYAVMTPDRLVTAGLSEYDITKIKESGEFDSINDIPYDKNMPDGDMRLRYLAKYVGDTLIVIGINISHTEHFWGLLKESRLLIDIIAIIVITFVIFNFFLSDIVRLAHFIREHKGKSLAAFKTKSYETEMFIKGLMSYEKTLNDLRARNKSLSDQVFPALQSEMISGKEPPYEFNCTLVRTDINNFSTIFATHPIEEYMTVVNNFFMQVTQIVARYNGLVYQFIGDEVIYYFKDEDHDNSAAVALSAVLEINELATATHQETMAKHGYAFVIKSSLGQGKLRFGLQINNFSLAGGVLIETVRILAEISDKVTNTIYYGAGVASEVEFFCTSNKEESVLLKGFAKNQQLYSFKERQPLAEVFAAILDNRCSDYLYYYRSEAEVLAILRFVNQHARLISLATYLVVVQVFKSYRLVSINVSVKQAYLELLKTLTAGYATISNQDFTYMLSATIAIAPHLIAKQQYDQVMAVSFKHFLGFDDRRVVANTIEVFAYFDAANADLMFERGLKQSDNRILANSLIKEAIRNFSKKTFRALARMIDADSILLCASGLYAIGEICKHYLISDPVLFHTHPYFGKLREFVKKHMTHEEPMVRRQAFIAASKMGDDEIKLHVFNLHKQHSDILHTEIDKYYFKNKKAA